MPHVWASARPAMARLTTSHAAAITERPIARDRRLLRTWNPIGAHRRVIHERRQDDGRLFEILLLHAVGGVDIRVMLAHVVADVVLDRIESEHPLADEAEVIRVADPLHHVAAGAKLLVDERREPRVEDRTGRRVAFQIPAVDRTLAGIDVEV